MKNPGLDVISFMDVSYLVRSSIQDPSAPVVVVFSYWSRRFHHEKAGRFIEGFGKEALLSIGLKVIEILTSRNDWYSGRTVNSALEEVRKSIEGSVCITYGNSMGGMLR